MTPHRRKEIDDAIEWWRKIENWRVNGFNIVCNDPLFARRDRVMTNNTQDKVLVLHYAFYDAFYALNYIEHGKEFVFTKRIKYEKHHGEFKIMYLEICWDVEERNWYNFWKKTTRAVTLWVDSDKFTYKYPHQNAYESEIVDCNN